MNDKFLYCKRNVWLNVLPNNNSYYLSFEKIYDNSVLVFEKGKEYEVIYDCTIKSDNGQFKFSFDNLGGYLYIWSVFITQRIKRKFKINKLLKYK